MLIPKEVENPRDSLGLVKLKGLEFVASLIGCDCRGGQDCAPKGDEGSRKCDTHGNEITKVRHNLLDMQNDFIGTTGWNRRVSAAYKFATIL